MEKAINKAIDMGWRIEKGVLTPPDELSRDVLKHTRFMRQSIAVPSFLNRWIEKHTIIAPDEKKRDELKAKVVNWLSQEWPGYLTECDGDEEWAKQIIVDDAHSDFGVDKDDVKEWLDACSSPV